MALAAAPAGVKPLNIALLVFLLVPVSFILMFWMKRKGHLKGSSKIEFPWFLLEFIAMSLIGSYVIGKWIIVLKDVMKKHLHDQRIYPDYRNGGTWA